MWQRGLLVLGVLAACAANPVERRQLADGSWRIMCQLPMDACVRQLEIVCPEKRYRIVNGESKRELRDVEPVVRETRTSELTAICTRYGDSLFGGAATPMSLPAGAGSAPSPAVSAGLAVAPVGSAAPPGGAVPGAAASAVSGVPVRVCAPGATQSCVGPAGCAGGQACRSDGTGFGACDCGSAKSPSNDAGS